MTRAQQDLVLEHLQAAVAIARKRIRRQPADREDAESAAVMGLIDAARTFDPAAGTPFMGFARWRIIGAIVEWQRANHVIAMSRLSEAETFTISLEDAADQSTPETPEDIVVAADLARKFTGGFDRFFGPTALVDRRRKVLAGMLADREGVETARELGVHKAEVSHLRREIRDAFTQVLLC